MTGNRYSAKAGASLLITERIDLSFEYRVAGDTIKSILLNQAATACKRTDLRH